MAMFYLCFDAVQQMAHLSFTRRVICNWMKRRTKTHKDTDNFRQEP
jgi:hypothetical protein